MATVSVRKSIIPKSWNVSETIRKRVGESVGRQRLIAEDGELLVVLHQLPRAEDKGRREGALFWIDSAGNWKSTPSSGGRSELKALVESYRKRIAELDLALDASEEPSSIHAVIDEATPVDRAGRHLQQVVSELRKALPDDLDILEIRDLAVDMDRAGDLLTQDARYSLDLMIAKSSAAQAKDANKAAKEAQKLNRLAAFFFPLMTIASVFGMNEPSEIASNPMIWAAVAIGLTLGAIVSGSLRKTE